MNHTLRLLLHILFKLNYFGPLVMGVMDSSFLLLPLGNDLVVVTLVIRNHAGYPLYVLTAVCGALIGTWLLELVARRIGDAGIERVAGKRRFEYLKGKIGENGGFAIAIACLAPPPFPYTAVVATVCGLGYPLKKLLLVVGISRAVRFLIIGALAIRYGRLILRVANSTPFRWTMFVFVFVCVGGSIFSLLKWFHKGKSGAPTPNEAAAQA